MQHEYHDMLYVRTVRVKIFLQQFVKFVHHFFDHKSCHTFMVCAGSTGIWNCSTFCQMCRNSVNTPHFHGKRRHNRGKRRHNPCLAALYKTVHCGAAIKVRHFWWEKSGTHAAMFSSAAATHVAFFLTCTVHLMVQ